MPDILISIPAEDLEKIRVLMVAMKVEEIGDFFACATVLTEGVISEHQKGRTIVSVDEENQRWYRFFHNWFIKIPRPTFASIEQSSSTEKVVNELLMTFTQEK